MISEAVLQVIVNFGVIPGLFIVLIVWYIHTTDKRIKYYEDAMAKHIEWMRDRIDKEGSHLKALYEEIEKLRTDVTTVESKPTKPAKK